MMGCRGNFSGRWTAKRALYILASAVAENKRGDTGHDHHGIRAKLAAPGREYYSTPPGTMTVGPVRPPVPDANRRTSKSGFFLFSHRAPSSYPVHDIGARKPGGYNDFPWARPNIRSTQIYKKKSNLVQRFPFRVLRTVSKPPLYVFAHALHSDIKVLYTTGMTRTYYERFNSHLSCHKNPPIIVPVLSLAIKKIK